MIVPMFPLQSALLPGESLPLRIFEPRYARLVQDCLGAAEPEFGVVLISRGSEVGGDDARSDVGALARIVHHVDLGDGQYELLAQVGDRLRVRSWLPDDPYQRMARARGGQLRPDLLAVDPETAADPGRHLYALAARVPMGQADRYAVLAAPTLAARVDVLLDAIATVTAMVEFQLSAD